MGAGVPVGVSTRQLLVSVVGVAALAAAASVGALELTLVDVVVLLGVAVVLPLALPGRWIWAAAAVGALASLRLDTGWGAALLVVPWLVAAGAAAATVVRGRWGGPWIDAFAPLVAALYAVVAGVAFASSRLGVTMFGIGEPIVELTAVHYTYAGCAALVLATRSFTASTGGWTRLAGVGVALTAVAPLVVAAGFVTHRPAPQVGGAVAMTIGVWCAASVELRVAADRRHPRLARILLGVSGIAVWIPMVLAVAWAAGQHWDVPALSIPAMERTHGLVNSLAFVLGGLLAWWLIDRSPDRAADDPAVVDVGAAAETAAAGPVGVP
jgi:hypothetical protein